jgi:hypothetical protein
MKQTKLHRIALFVLLVTFLFFNAAASAQPYQGDEPPQDDLQIEEVNPYFAVTSDVLTDGSEIVGYRINGPAEPFQGIEADRQASIMPLPNRGVIADFPSYDWVFGCSAVSGAMIAAYYDRNGYDNMYTGPTDGGVMPVTDTSWPTWFDGDSTYPNNPLIASHDGVDGRSTRGSIDDYWVSYGSSVADPYISNWVEHTWGTAIGDYMKTSQSNYFSVDGSTWFFSDGDGSKLTCSEMENQSYSNWPGNISDYDGTYGRKLFYEARGYTVGDCYNEKTDNNDGGFSLSDFQAEIDAGHPVLLNLQGHSIVGYGYSGSTIYIRDTWDSNTANTYTMPWGGSYDPPNMAPMELLSVSVVHPEQPPLPSAPNGVSASDGTYADRVRVSWNASSGATYYKVFRNTSSSHVGETELTSSQSSTSSPYNDMSAVTETEYYYWVQACNSAGCSGYSGYDTGWRSVTPSYSFAYLPLVIKGSVSSISDPIENGDFEQGRVAWTEYSVYGYYLIYEFDPGEAHSGTWLAYFLGEDVTNGTDRLSQTVTISGSIPYLHFWYHIASYDGCGFDFARVKVNGSTVKTLDLCSTTSTTGWTPEVVNLSAYAGDTVTLMFEATTDGSLDSYFYIDDVSFSNSASAQGGDSLLDGIDLSGTMKEYKEE